MTKYQFTLLPINQMWYGKTKCIFEFSTTKLVKPTYFGFYRRKKGFFLKASAISPQFLSATTAAEQYQTNTTITAMCKERHIHH